MNLSELHQMHARHLASMRRSPHTIRHYRHGVAILERFLTEKGLSTEVAQITRPILTEFMIWNRERGLQPGGEHAQMRAIRATIRWAFEEEMILSDPTARIKLPSLPNESPPAVQPHEVQAMLDITKGWRHPMRDAALLLTLYDTGLRTGEIAGLKTSDVDVTKGVIHVRAETSKREKGRVVPLGVRAARAITRYERQERKPASERIDTLFLGREGMPMGRSALGQLLARLARSAGIPRENAAPHAWRRGFAVEFLRQGGNLFSLQQILGHSSLQMSRRYVTYLPQDLMAEHMRASPADRL